MISQYVRFYRSWRTHHGIVPSLKRVWWKMQQNKRLKRDLEYLLRRMKNDRV